MPDARPQCKTRVLILRGEGYRYGPGWQEASAEDIDYGSVFLVLEDGKPGETPYAVMGPSTWTVEPVSGVMATPLLGLSRNAVRAIYGAALRAGVSRERAVMGIIYMRKDASDG